MKSYLKRNKPLLFLPLVLIPFVVLIFYILGGGTGKEDKDRAQIKNDPVRGANYSLPDADRDIRIYDKMEAARSQNGLTQTHDYNILGEKDSVQEDILRTPDEATETIETTEISETDATDPQTVDTENSIDPDAQLNTDIPRSLLEHIRSREAQLRKDLQDEPGLKQEKVEQQTGVRTGKPATANPERKNKTSDPAIATESVIPTGIMELNMIFTQNKKLAESNDSLNSRLSWAEGQLKRQEEENSRSFTLEKSAFPGFNPPDSEKQSTPGMVPIRAEIYETATVLSGNRVKLRLMEDCRVNGIKIPRSTFVYGTCTVNNERLEVSITQFPVSGTFMPVQISIYDLDGLKGLYVPDNASRKAAKEAGSSVNTSSMFGVANNPLMYAGIQAADRATQSLTKMIRIKKVTVKKNTLVYLVNKSK
jgi:conjugative transposon TraM protein